MKGILIMSITKAFLTFGSLTCKQENYGKIITNLFRITNTDFIFAQVTKTYFTTFDNVFFYGITSFYCNKYKKYHQAKIIIFIF